ncbi:MAG: DUF6263 family protein [Gemmatales bacterium]|nr:DUF6263 family protein [Gemmatales bacterium]MDW7995422.1 DUF6263 family protein [Gemmatales bacterium]
MLAMMPNPTHRAILGKALVVLWASLGIVSSLQAQAVNFTWKLRAGDVFYHLTDTEVTTTVALPQGDNTERSRLIILHRYEVLQSDPKGYVLQQTVEEVETNDSGILGNIYNQFRGLKLKLTIDPNFRITKIEGLEQLLERLGTEDPVLGKFVAELVNENVIRQQLQSEFHFLPEKPVAPGDKWQRHLSLTVGPLGTLSLDQTFTYQGTTSVGGKTLDRIEMSARATFSPPKGNEDLPVRVTKGELQEQSLKGSYLFDREAGRLVSAQWEGKYRFRLYLVEGKPNPTKELVMDLTQHQTHRSEVTTERPRVPSLRNR